MALDNEFREMVDNVRDFVSDAIPTLAEDVVNRVAMLTAILDKTDASEAEPATVAAYREELELFRDKAQAVINVTGSPVAAGLSVD